MKYILISLLVFLISIINSADAQIVVVRDQQTGHAIPQATISMSNGDILYTDSTGQFNLNNVDNYEYLMIRHWNYATVSINKKELLSANYVILLNATDFDLSEVIISANKTETKREDLPIQTLAINQSEIEFQNAATTADLMVATGEITVQKSQQGGGSPVMRGFEANKVLLVIDGVRMNNAIYRGGHLQNIITVDPSILEKTEVIYGPSSVIYGSDALGGVIHFYTKNPKLSLNNNLRTDGQAFAKYASANDEKTIQLALNFGGQKFASYTLGSYSDFGDLRQGSIRNPFYGDWGKRLFYADRIDNRDTIISNGDGVLLKQSGYTQYNLMQKFLWKPSASVQHLLNVQYSSSSDIPRYDRLTEVNAQGDLRSAEWYYGPQDRLLGSYIFSYNSLNKMFDKLNVNLAYQNIEESRHNRNFRNNFLDHRIEKLDIISANIDFFKNFNSQSIQYGLEVYHNDLNSTAFRENIVSGVQESLFTRYPDGGAKMTTIAAYISHQKKFGDQFILHNGIRYTNTNLTAVFIDTSFFPFPFNDIEQNHGAISASVGGVLKIRPDLNARLNLSTGFRAPNVDDLAKVFDSAAGSLVIPNPDLKPEYLYNIDFGIDKQFDNNTEISANAFYSFYDKVITRQRTQFNGSDSIIYNGTLSQVFHYQNADKANLYGANIKLVWNLNTHWSLFSSLTYTFGSIDTDSTNYPLDHIPPLFGKTALQYKNKSWNIELSTLYNGWKHLEDYNLSGEDNQQYASPLGTPAWWTLNFKSSVQLNKQIQLQFAVENILDHYYRPFASGISGAGRNIIMGIRGKF